MAEEKPKRIQVNVPMTEEEKTAIQEAAQARGLSNSEFLRQAAQAAMLDNLAEAVPEQGDAIAEFQAMTERLTACYQAALEHSRDAYDRASAKVRKDLEALGTLVAENRELKKRITELEIECQEAHETAAEAQTMLNATAADSGKIAELERKLMDAERKLLEVEKEHDVELKKVRDELERKLTDAERKLFETEKQHAAELRQVRDEGFQQLVQLVKAQQGQ